MGLVFLTLIGVGTNGASADQARHEGPTTALLTMVAAERDQRDDPFWNALAEGLNAAQREDCASAVLALTPEIDRPQFSTLNVESQLLVYGALARCADAIDDAPLTHQIVQRMVALRPDDTDLLHLQLLVSLPLEDAATAKSALFQLGQAGLGALDIVELQTIWRVLGLLNDQPDANSQKLEVLDLLREQAYAPQNPLAALDRLNKTYVGLLIDAGRTEEIAVPLSRIFRPDMLLEMHVDRHFEPVRSIPGSRRRLDDLAVSAEAYLAITRNLAWAYPDRLRAVINGMWALRILGRNDEAARLGLAAVDGMAWDAFTDKDKSLSWFLNEWAYALYYSGRTEEGHEAMRLAIDVGRDRKVNVSQMINYARMQIYTGDYGGALATIDEVDEANPYGRMLIHQVRACAYLLNGRPRRARQDLTYVAENRDANEGAYAVVLLCADDLDTLATVYIERLENPDKRPEALLSLQTYQPTGVILPGEALLRARLDEVRARDDVRRAAEAVGRLEEIPLYGPHRGDL